MSQGRVEAIYLHPAGGGPMLSVPGTRALAGLGLEGDTYTAAAARSSGPRAPEQEVTLIEAEAIEAVNRDENLVFGLGESRRNVVTRDVPLNHLVGRRFRVGGVELHGIELCEPCKHLESLTRPRVLKAFLHRGGLRAEIVEGGEIRVGDPVEF